MGVVSEGRTLAECEEGRVEGAGQHDMFCPSGGVLQEARPCCYTTCMDSMACDFMTQCHATLCQPVLWVHAQVIKISGIKILFFF